MDISPKTKVIDINCGNKKECVLEVDVINLRNMLPVNLLPALNPYVEFDTGTKSNRVKTKSSNKPSGSNPVFLQARDLSYLLILLIDRFFTCESSRRKNIFPSFEYSSSR